jgi:hypothetical protein
MNLLVFRLRLFENPGGQKKNGTEKHLNVLGSELNIMGSLSVLASLGK